MTRHLINRASSVSKMSFSTFFSGNITREILERIQVLSGVRNPRKSDRVKRIKSVAPTGRERNKKCKIKQYLSLMMKNQLLIY